MPEPAPESQPGSQPGSWNIALWGPASAGKTAFLAQLYRQSAKFKSDWDIYTTEEADQFLDSVGQQMDECRFPKATAVTTTSIKVAYRFKHKKDGTEASLATEDRPGADSEELPGHVKQWFNAADALILLYDPDRGERAFEKDVEWYLRKLGLNAGRGVGQDLRPVAVCMSKSDQMIRKVEDLRRAERTPREFVLEKTTQQLEGLLAKFCASYEFFPISSVGLSVRHGVVEHAVFRDEHLALRLGSTGVPLNLMAPIAWIFDRLRGART